jgi:hypothetical protein
MSTSVGDHDDHDGDKKGHKLGRKMKKIRER